MVITFDMQGQWMEEYIYQVGKLWGMRLFHFKNMPTLEDELHLLKGSMVLKWGSTRDFIKGEVGMSSGLDE